MNRMVFGPGVRLAALQAASFAGIGIWMPFFPVWLGERGIGADAIGVILALPIVVRIVAVAPLMALVDGGCLGSALVYLALLKAEGVVVLGLLVALLAVAQAPVIPASDLVTLQAV